jgi:hypothetical protein
MRKLRVTADSDRCSSRMIASATAMVVLPR